MPHHTEELAILFADISGSTVLYETLGNAAARRMVANCLALMSARLAPHGGTLIKTMGDEIMCAFPSAQAAALAACEMQEAVEQGRPGGDTPMYVRIGFNFGEVIREANDLHGDAVNVAARVTEVARARQILATLTAVEALPPELRQRAHHVRRANLKGRQAQLDLYLLRWSEHAELPRTGSAAQRRPENHEALLLVRQGAHQFTLDARNPSVTLGRAPDCAIVIDEACVEEHHATLECRFGKFYLSDRSVRGSYLRVGGGESIQLVGEAIRLRGSGQILLGRPFSESPAGIVEYSIRLAPTQA